MKLQQYWRSSATSWVITYGHLEIVFFLVLYIHSGPSNSALTGLFGGTLLLSHCCTFGWVLFTASQRKLPFSFLFFVARRFQRFACHTNSKPLSRAYVFRNGVHACIVVTLLGVCVFCARVMFWATAVRGSGGMRGGREDRAHVSFPGGLHQLLFQGRNFALPLSSAVAVESYRRRGGGDAGLGGGYRLFVGTNNINPFPTVLVHPI